MSAEPEADRVIHDHLLENSGEPYTNTFTIEDGHVTEHVRTETHQFNYNCHTGELESIEYLGD